MRRKTKERVRITHLYVIKLSDDKGRMILLKFVSPTFHESVILPQVKVYNLTNELQCKVPYMPISIYYYSGNYRNFCTNGNGLLPVVSNNSF